MTAYNQPQQPITQDVVQVQQAVQDMGDAYTEAYRIRDEQDRGIDVYPAQGTSQPR